MKMTCWPSNTSKHTRLGQAHFLDHLRWADFPLTQPQPDVDWHWPTGKLTGLPVVSMFDELDVGRLSA